MIKALKNAWIWINTCELRLVTSSLGFLVAAVANYCYKNAPLNTPLYIRDFYVVANFIGMIAFAGCALWWFYDVFLKRPPDDNDMRPA